MPVPGRDTSPTRSAALELREERRLVQEGFEFLDEKRLLLAAEILQQLEAYRSIHREYLDRHAEASAALAAAAGRHGLDGLQVYPAAEWRDATVRTRSRNFLGVPLVEARLEDAGAAQAPEAVRPSAEAEWCRRAFAALIECAARLAALSGNLHRLADEYRRTERRARALENVLLPEIDEALHEIDDHLEALEQEEAVRVRKAHRSGSPTQV
ncbi:MAG: ATPase [Gammaproteobacteria bacterium]|nr:ATPase [Gammaproteobacteria bacterium]NIR85635.1 ATPase [Gammaproteobacteria bacterium]NIR90123.1 ATPase [Gammaproteobacteria bacterium]NIU06769.1 ATPase [Gammaproteobacteria bacterium]NIV53702.1 ATPase [Gammaproteobacteria bacterium]